MKYAMIPINRRYTDDWKRIVRRVLISYDSMQNGLYKGTRLVAKDPYFSNPKSSQEYVFTDTDFWLVKDGYNDIIQSRLLNVKRPYQYSSPLLIETAIEFMANDDTEAIEKFMERGDI